MKRTSLSSAAYTGHVDSTLRMTRERYDRWNPEIAFPRTHDFNRDKEDAEEIKTLTKDDLTDFYKSFIAPGGKQRKKFVAQVFSHHREMPERVEEGTVLLDDCRKFVAAAELYSPVYNLAEQVGK